MTKLKLLTFDITNTIIKVSGTPGYHYSKIAKLHGVNTDHKLVYKSFRRAWTEKNEEMPNFGIHNGITAYEWWFDVVKRSFGGAGYEIEPKLLKRIFAHLYEHYKEKNTWEVYPRSHQVLSSLKDKGLILGVISNFDERLEGVLSEHDLLKYFEFVVTSIKVGYWKPHPRIFQIALELGKCYPHEGAHVGDNIITDFNGAHNVGMRAFLLHTPEQELKDLPEERYILRDIHDIVGRVHGPNEKNW